MSARSAGLGVVLLLMLGSAGLAQQPSPDPAAQIRALAESGRLDQAGDVVDAWMKAHPEDLDARAWHARLQAWTKHWPEAEAEYRQLLIRSPRDVDLLAGLADVLYWQRRGKEALPLLDRACELDNARADIRLRRARVLQDLGRLREARAAYQDVLTRDAASADAKRGIEQLREADRHEFRVGADFDLLNYAGNGEALAASLQSRWNPAWSSSVSISQYRRFDEPATRVAADATYHLSPQDHFTMGGAAAHDHGIIPRAETQFEYGHGFRFEGDGPVRGIETLYQQRWMWYRDARLLLLSPGAVLYFPRDWYWLVRISANRIGITGAGTEWKPSGWTRLNFPVRHRLGAHLLFAVGTENFGYLDQILQSASRTWGGGLRFHVAPGQELMGYSQYQSLSGGRAQTSFGLSYAIRF